MDENQGQTDEGVPVQITEKQVMLNNIQRIYLYIHYIYIFKFSSQMNIHHKIIFLFFTSFKV